MVRKQKFHLLVLSMNKIAWEAAMILEKDGRRTLTAHDIAPGAASLILGDLTRYHKVHGFSSESIHTGYVYPENYLISCLTDYCKRKKTPKNGYLDHSGPLLP
jgi:hypothetical protein